VRQLSELYQPINLLAPVAPDVWVVDGPAIRFHGMPFTTRMTVVRLEGGLWIHSPIEPDPALAAAIDVLGPVRYLIAPNSLHYWWIPDWKTAYPAAEVWAVPGAKDRAKRALPVDRTLSRDIPRWADAIDHTIVEGRLFTEAVFCHRATGTAMLADLIENFEPARLRSRTMRAMVKLAGCADPDGKAPIDMRWSFAGKHAKLREAVDYMVAWDPTRVVLAHGRWYDHDGRAELERAFRWV
jgi:hypothetical protein